MSSNEYLIDIFNRHAVYINRLGTGEYKRVEKYINRAIKAATDKLGEAKTEYQTIRYTDIIRSLQIQLDQIFREMNDEWTVNLNRFAIYESEFTAKALDGAIAGNAAVNIPDTDLLVNAALNKPLKLKSKQLDINFVLREYSKGKQRMIIDTIQEGLINGETIEDLKSRLTGVSSLSKRQARAVSRTVTNHVMTEARNQTFENNKDIIDGFRVIATLDSKTSLICGAKDNQVYDWSDPKPPFHYNCRSSITPVIKDQYNKSIEGYRPAKGSDGKDKVGAYTNYGNWLKRQSAEYQKDVLGKTRYDLFREGKVEIEDFIDSNDNILSIEELMRREQLTLDF